VSPGQGAKAYKLKSLKRKNVANKCEVKRNGPILLVERESMDEGYGGKSMEVTKV
jgi:hypothetical protein